MKKYVLLFAANILIISGLVTFSVLSGSGTKITFYRLTAKSVESTITCKGKIEEKSTEKVYASLPVVAGEIAVSQGERVEAGQVLMMVNREETQAASENLLDIEIAQSVGLNVDTQSIPDQICAPISGIVQSVDVSTGDMVDPTKPLFTLTDSNELQLKTTVNETQIAKLKTGQQADIVCSAYQDRHFVGTVTKIASSARQQVVGTATQTVVDVVISVDSKQDVIKPGFSATAKVTVSQDDHILCVPYQMVRQDTGGEYVYVVQNSRAVKTYVQTGRELDEGFEVINGVSAGNLIVQNPDVIKRNGEKINLGV